jgi:hypothetical protein
VVRAFGDLEQGSGTDPADDRMIPPGQCFGTNHPIVCECILRLEQDLDLVAVDRFEKVGLELLVGPPGAGHLPGRPVDPSPIAFAHARGHFGQAVEHAVGIVVFGHAHQGQSRPQAQACPAFRIGDRHRNRVGQRFGQPLPAFAAAFLPRDKQEIPAAQPRREPCARAFQLVSREMLDALRDLDQRAITGSLAERDVHGVDPAKRDHHRLHRAGDRFVRPVTLPLRDGFARLRLIRQAGERIAGFVDHFLGQARHAAFLIAAFAELCQFFRHVAKWDAQP